MNEWQQILFSELESLVATNEAFFAKDFYRDGLTYRVFNYRLASYTDFCQPGALECRGIAFVVDHDKPVRLASLPMRKFFNLYENPMTMDLDLSTVKYLSDKMDGSLISTFLHVNPNKRVWQTEVRVKTRGSLESDQSVWALRYLQQPENKEFYHELHVLAMTDHTVNMEYISPDNRVVIGYQQEDLIVLNVRNHNDGSYIDLPNTELSKLCPEICKRWTKKIAPDNPIEFINNIPNMKDVEGYVAHLPDMLVKIKTEWYLTQHRAKDSVDSPRRLFEAVLEEATDDLRSLFHDNPIVLQRIGEMEQKVDHLYNHTVNVVETFYETNKELERKDYAILGQKEVDRRYFGLVMSKYLGKPVDYKAFLKKHYKDFGIKDDEPKEDE